MSTVFSQISSAVADNARKVFKTAAALIYPPRCVFCGRYLGISPERGYDICVDCKVHVRKLLIGPARPPDRSIMHIDDVFCLFRYKDKIRESLVRYKFGNKASYSRTYGYLLSLIVKGMPSNVPCFDMLLAVPLHAKRETERGYDQARLIASHLCRLTAIPYRKGILSRSINTDKQSMLGKADRIVNVSGAFCIGKPDIVKEKCILLLDDIITTGSTVSECARILKDAGARYVAAIAVASGRGVYLEKDH